MKTILTIRANQARRFLGELGWWRLLLLLAAVGMGTFGAFAWAVRSRTLPPGPGLPLLWAAGMASLLFFHVTRPDWQLLQMLGRRRRWVYAVEYGVALLPCLVWGLVAFRPGLTLGLVLEIAGLSVLDYNLRTNRRYLNLAGWLGGPREPGAAGTALRLPGLPVEAFEWRSGLRRTGPLLAVGYGAALVFSGHPAAVPVALFALSLATVGFYFDCESRDVLQLFALRHPHFLAGKLRNQYLLCWGGCLPLVVLHAVRHPGALHLLGYAVLTGSVSQALAVVLKYARYAPGRNLNHNAYVLALAVLGLALPHVAAVPLVLTVVYYRKARANLLPYLA
ncbi:MAG: hypothetical protein ICV83_30440 [Cytophagales bacterium]|nr:hypothetical protein [Cytophagales bacterium]